MKQAAALALVVSMVAAPLAQAQDDSGFYVGGQIGQGKLELKDSNFSESGVGFGAYGGYRFNSWFALEANLLVADNLDSDNLDILSGYTSIAPKFTWQLNDTFSLYAKAGIARGLVRVDNGYWEEDFDGYGWLYGLGLDAALTESLHLRLGYEMLKVELDSEFNYGARDLDTDMSNLALGLHWQF
ncbi:porin family protein [Shewanella algae]|uniref:porin family protein n=1 Tax=Shewanella algae TaxID=38313 RepID=UPI000B8AC123|nr:porin family protein [Shewanella algae]OXR99077.1 hypothetical protein AMR44_20265 [Shewanella algae]